VPILLFDGRQKRAKSLPRIFATKMTKKAGKRREQGQICNGYPGLCQSGRVGGVNKQRGNRSWEKRGHPATRKRKEIITSDKAGQLRHTRGW